MRIEFDALRTVPGFRRALALALAFSGFLAISYLGLKDLDTTTLDRRAQRAVLRRDLRPGGDRVRRGARRAGRSRAAGSGSR